MWVAVVLLLCLLALSWTYREGWTGTPSDAADQQTGDLRYMQKKIANIMSVLSADELDKHTVQVSRLEQKVTDLEAKMKEFLETKKVNDTMGYPNDDMEKDDTKDYERKKDDKNGRK